MGQKLWFTNRVLEGGGQSEVSCFSWALNIWHFCDVFFVSWVTSTTKYPTTVAKFKLMWYTL